MSLTTQVVQFITVMWLLTTLVKEQKYSMKEATSILSPNFQKVHMSSLLVCLITLLYFIENSDVAELSTSTLVAVFVSIIFVGIICCCCLYTAFLLRHKNKRVISRAYAHFSNNDEPEVDDGTTNQTDTPETDPATDYLLQDIHGSMSVEQNQSHSIDFVSRIDSPVNGMGASMSDNHITDKPLTPSPFSGPVVDSYNTQSYLPTWFTPVASLLECTHHGRTYWDDTNDFGLDIPAGAIPEGVTLSIDIGVALYGPFQFPQGLRPASPVFWICVRQLEFSEFEKPIIVTLPHFFSLKNQDAIESLGLAFLKAKHERNKNQMFEFLPTDGITYFEPHKKVGVLETTHFCSLCVSCADTMEAIKSAEFCITALIPRRILLEESSYADFYITFLLATCLSKLNKQLDDLKHPAERENQKFQFSKKEDQALEMFYPNSVQDKWAFGYRRQKRV